MATQTYMYLNNGTKVPVYGNTNTHSMPYRTYVTETVQPKNSTSTKKISAGSQTVTANSSIVQQDTEKIQRRAKIDAINANRKKETKRLNENYALMKQEAKQNNANNLRQLYIAYMQGLRGIPQQSALWGAGGEIESLKNRSRLNYETNRAKENSSYSGIIGDIQQKYNNDLNELEKKYLQQLLNV